MKDVENLREIRKQIRKAGFSTPLIADVHFHPEIAEVAATIVEKVRINPGNYLPEGRRRISLSDDSYLKQVSDRMAPLIKICRQYGTAIRIGVNHGSLSPRILERYGNTPEGMVESALEFARICDNSGFRNLVLSLKASNTRVMIRANRLLVDRLVSEGMDYPLHLGVTEAGEGEDGRFRSAIGIGSLLAEGIGDTIRVSITEEPEHEIPVAYSILQATGVRITRTEYISCPSCARTLFDIRKSVQQIREATGHLTGLKIAVMGCIVNGPGEMADAHYGYVGAGKGKVNLYKGQQLVRKNVPESEAVKEMVNLIKEHGDWI
jgi:(E)-4-hydroxy-3-methylbut-2-enyl-diphosphate synthase